MYSRSSSCWVQHYSDSFSDCLGWKIVSEFCTYCTCAAMWTCDFSPNHSDLARFCLLWQRMLSRPCRRRPHVSPNRILYLSWFLHLQCEVMKCFHAGYGDRVGSQERLLCCITVLAETSFCALNISDYM